MRICSARGHWSHVRWHSHRRLTCTGMLVGLATALLLGGFGAANARASSLPATTWQAQDASSAGGNARLYSVAFVDPAHGWAVGPTFGSDGNPTSSVILATSDGGATWKAQDASSAGDQAMVESVTFVDAAHGWAVGGNSNGPLILATSDGGAAWKAQDASSAGSKTFLYSVDFVDAVHGWAVGNTDSGGNHNTPTILATSDGGTSWKAQDASGAGSKAVLESVTFADAAHGWVVGPIWGSGGNITSALILATSDGGATWKAQDASGAGDNPTLDSVASVDATHCWIAGGNKNGPVILATSDGGATWKAQDASSAGGANVESVTFADAAHGWVVGDGGTILATTNGGATWMAQATSAAGDAYLNSVTSGDAAHSWAVGFIDTSGDSTPVILAARTTAAAGAANTTAAAGAGSSKSAAPWLVVAVIVVFALIVALGAAAAIHWRKAAGAAVAADPLMPEAGGPIGESDQLGAAQADGEKARFCTSCGSAVGADSSFCASCGAKVIR